LATSKFFFDWNLEEAKRDYQTAINLDEEYGHAHHWLSILLAVQDQLEEADAQIERAIQLDSSAVFIATRARISYFGRRFSEARERYSEALALKPSFIPALLGRGLSSVMERDYPAAQRDYDLANTLLGGHGLVVHALQGHLAGREGNTEAALEKVRQLQGYEVFGVFVPPEYYAMVYLGLGYHDEVLGYLDLAFENGSSAMTILRVDPLVDGLRGDPRFQDLLDRVERGRGG
jgi:tetratricopeptide (TPR) repeat protein